jgi:hypothetical protein
MVLKSVGAWFEGANKKVAVLGRYMLYAWMLAKRHTEQLPGFQESPLRLVDMALSVQHGEDECRTNTVIHTAVVSRPGSNLVCAKQSSDQIATQMHNRRIIEPVKTIAAGAYSQKALPTIEKALSLLRSAEALEATDKQTIEHLLEVAVQNLRGE